MDADIAFKTKEHTSCQNEQSCSCGSKQKQCEMPQKRKHFIFTYNKNAYFIDS